MKVLIFLLSAVILYNNAFAQNWQKQVKTLDKYIENAIEVWESPGLAVAVVKDGEIIFTKGYGTRTIGKNEPVDEHTLFVCASTTKAFTAAALGMLVDDGKLNWDDKVIDHLPEFRLKDPYVTREITVRDLLTHRSGLGNTDYLWTSMDIDADSAISRLVDSDLRYSMRSSFIYQNLMYNTAGEVVEAISGIAWADFLKQRIYSPIGMKDTYPHLSDVKSIDNKATGHYWIDGKITPIPQMSADAIGPAGSMWSSISDMSKWIQFLDNNGIINGDTLISAKVFNELFEPQQLIPPNQFYPSMQITEPSWRSYGLGWFQHDYMGKKVDFHTGSLPGMVALAGLIRSENVGVYVFGNLDHVELRHAIMYSVFDLFTEGKLSRDWSKELKALYDNREEDEEEPVRVDDAPAIIQVADLLGTYKNSKRGKITISLEGDNLFYSLNGVVNGQLAHWHYDTYQITYDRAWYGDGMITFRMDEEGKVAYLEVWDLRFDRIEED